MAIPNTITDLNVATRGETVTPSDVTSYANGAIARALYVGVAGNVTLVAFDGNNVLFTAVPAGTILPIAHTRVNSTGTTATSMTALF